MISHYQSLLMTINHYDQPLLINYIWQKISNFPVLSFLPSVQCCVVRTPRHGLERRHTLIHGIINIIWYRVWFNNVIFKESKQTLYPSWGLVWFGMVWYLNVSTYGEKSARPAAMAIPNKRRRPPISSWPMAIMAKTRIISRQRDTGLPKRA